MGGAYDLSREEEDCEEGDAHDDGLPLPLHASANKLNADTKQDVHRMTD
jgi:hypothetical protein